MGNNCCVHERIIVDLKEVEFSVDLENEYVFIIDPTNNTANDECFFNEMSEGVKDSPLSPLWLQ